MFSFFKKKNEYAPKIHTQQTAANNENLQEEIRVAESRLMEAGDSATKVKLWDELGSLCKEAGEVDKAIGYFEQSIEAKPVFGKACTDLMALYNIKRREAAEAKDDEKIQMYLNKLDELMKINKSIMRSSIS